MAGALAGLLLGPSTPPEGVALWVVGLTALLGGVLLLASPGAPDAREGPAGALAGRARAAGLLAACFLCGLVLGARSSVRAAEACTAGLPRDEAVRAAGTAVRVDPAPDDGGAARLELAPAVLSARAARCRVPALAISARGGRVPRPGDAVEAHGRWRPYPGAGELRRPEHRGRLRADALSARAEPPGAGPGLLRRTAARWRGRAAARLDRRLPADAAALARALTLADRGGLPEELSRRFARAGLAHLLAISGLHVGVLAAAAAGLIGLRLPSGPRHVAAAGLTGLYVAWIGAPPSAVRAGLLYAGWALARLRGSPVRTSDLLGAAAAVAVMADPMTALDPGFQLSFAGFAGVALGAAAGGRWARERELGRRARGLVLSAAAGAGACALTAPLTALHFQGAAPVAAVSGLLGTPLVGLSLLSSLAALGLPGALAEPAAGAATGLLRLLTRLVDGFASVPGGYSATAPPGPVYAAVALLLLVAWLRYVRGAPVARCWTPAAAALAAVLAGPALLGARADLRAGSSTLMCTLDVGQGDAAAVRTRRGHWLLLDVGPRSPPGRGGTDEGLATVVPFLRDRGARSVELLVLSHAHLDHVGGGEAVLGRLEVRKVASSGAPYGGAPHLGFLRAVRRERARWLTLRTGDRMRLDEVQILVLDDGGEDAAGRVRSGRERRRAPNDAGVSLRLRIDGGFTWVTTGDASMRREVAMLGRWPRDTLRADLLSVGHHGSLTSTSPAWVEAVDPELAVVSAGAGNWFGHPHPLTLRTLAEAGVRVRRTDRNGTVCVRAEGDGSWRLAE